MGSTPSSEINEVESKIETLIEKVQTFEEKCQKLTEENESLRKKLESVENEQKIRAARFASIKHKLFKNRKEISEDESENDEDEKLERMEMSF